MNNVNENYENKSVVRDEKNNTDLNNVMFTSYPDLLDITQLKEMLGIGITLAYRLVRMNNIHAIKIGRQYKIPKRNVISYITNQN